MVAISMRYVMRTCSAIFNSVVVVHQLTRFIYCVCRSVMLSVYIIMIYLYWYVILTDDYILIGFICKLYGALCSRICRLYGALCRVLVAIRWRLGRLYIVFNIVYLSLYYFSLSLIYLNDYVH